LNFKPVKIKNLIANIIRWILIKVKTKLWPDFTYFAEYRDTNGDIHIVLKDTKFPDLFHKRVNIGQRRKDLTKDSFMTGNYLMEAFKHSDSQWTKMNVKLYSGKEVNIKLDVKVIEPEKQGSGLTPEDRVEILKIVKNHEWLN
jgi:hypothetical protein